MRSEKPLTGVELIRIEDEAKEVMADPGTSDDEKIAKIVALVQRERERRKIVPREEDWQAYVVLAVRLALPDPAFQRRVWDALGEPDLEFGPPKNPISGYPEKA